MYNIDQIILLFECFCELGVSLLIDDFGIGYLLFVYLWCLLLDVLKVDCLFIMDIFVLQWDMEIVQVIIVMVQKFYLKVVVEGVEILQ